MPESIVECVYVIILTSIFIWLIAKPKWAKSTGLSSVEIRGLFLIKVMVGVSLAIFYQLYYDNRLTDVFRFYDDALIVFESLKINPKIYFQIIFGINLNDPDVVIVTDQLNTWYKIRQHGVFNDNQTMVRFHAILLIFSQGYFHVHTVVFSLLSFSGFIALIKVFNEIVSPRKWFLYLVILFPQLIFWSSGVLKEALLFFSLGWFLFYLFELYKGVVTKKTLLGALVFLSFLLLVKGYVIIALIPGITIIAASSYVPKLKSPVFFAGILVLQFLLVVGVDSLNGSKRVERIYQKQHDFITEAKRGKAGSLFKTFELQPNWTSVVLNAPKAVLNVFIRPLPWNAHSAIAKFASIENLIILLSMLLPFVFYHPPDQNKMVLVLFSLSFVMVLFLLIGLVTPVSGAIIRYKIPALPFLFFAIYLLTDWKKIDRILSTIFPNSNT